jgi:hypothetical protein
VADPRPGHYCLASATGPDGRAIVLEVREVVPATRTQPATVVTRDAWGPAEWEHELAARILDGATPAPRRRG